MPTQVAQLAWTCGWATLSNWTNKCSINYNYISISKSLQIAMCIITNAAFRKIFCRTSYGRTSSAVEGLSLFSLSIFANKERALERIVSGSSIVKVSYDMAAVSCFMCWWKQPAVREYLSSFEKRIFKCQVPFYCSVNWVAGGTLKIIQLPALASYVEPWCRVEPWKSWSSSPRRYWS